MSAPMVGNDFMVPRPARSVLRTPIAIPVTAVPSDYTVAVHTAKRRRFSLYSLLHIYEQYAVASFAALILLVGFSASLVVQSYANAHYASQSAIGIIAHSTASINESVATSGLGQRLAQITGQPATLNVGETAYAIPAATIRDWIKITPSADGGTQMLHIVPSAVAQSVVDLANSHVVTPVNQISTGAGVIAAGRNGIKLTDPAALNAQAQSMAKTLFAGSGVHLSAPTETLPFQAVTPAAFSKMIEVNVSSKQMYMYENGQVVKQYAISAGAPATPTPIGQYHIFAKYAVQDMKGLNADGSKYFQPHVRWINYFLPGGYAIHGNYWRPLSWFGVVNSSHGCASLPDDEAEWVYDWAPMGTTVVTHA